MKAGYGQVLIVDGGGFFPELDTQQDQAWFQMDAMKLLGTDAVGVGSRDLRFGLAYLRETARNKKLPLVSANLLDKKTRAPALAPWLVKKVGAVNVGVFSVISDKVDLGPSRDSIEVSDPQAAARKAVAELKKKGATVIVALSQLGKVESEDLVSAVEGIDAVIVGLNSPLLQKGRLIKSTIACYGGEQGQNIGRTTITLNAARKMASGDNESYILGPDIPEKPEVLQIVKAFEDSFNEKMRKLDKEKAASQAAKVLEESPDRFLGADLCMRCHVDQAEQWKTTPHAHAWQTLVDAKKESTPECIPCHVVGYQKPGGFQGNADAAKLANVQCENCHGMGTKHEAFPQTATRMSEKVCITCHQGENDPAFVFSEKLPKVIH